MTLRWCSISQSLIGISNPTQGWTHVLAGSEQAPFCTQMLSGAVLEWLFSFVWEWGFIALFLEQAHLDLARLFVLRTKLSFVAYWTSCYFIQAELFQQMGLCSPIKDYHEKKAQIAHVGRLSYIGCYAILWIHAWGDVFFLFFPLFFLPMLKVERKVYFSEAFQLLGGPEVFKLILKMLSLIFIMYVL